MDETIEIPDVWQRLPLSELRGPLLLAGDSDVGKSTFGRYLYTRLSAAGVPCAYLDGDPGQTRLGPPTTLTLAMGRPGDTRFPPSGSMWQAFVGAVSPRGHMLPLVIGAHNLVAAARAAGAEAIVWDTSGLVDPALGGTTLKLAEIDLVRPVTLLALQRERELEALLAPLRRSRRVRVIEVPPAAAVRQRSPAHRRAHRATQFAGYFADARTLSLRWSDFAVLPAPRFYQHRLLALEDAQGFVLGLGIVLSHDPPTRQLLLHTPLASTTQVDAIRLGDLLVDPDGYTDQALGPALAARSRPPDTTGSDRP